MCDGTDMKAGIDEEYLFVLVRVSPTLKDVSELTSIISNSTRLLYGDLQPRNVQVLDLMSRNKCRGGFKDHAIIRVDLESVDYMCAALTLSTPPSFMDQFYRIDILQIEKSLECINRASLSP